MITVISLRELKTLMTEKQISRSENIAFIQNEALRSLIMNQIFEHTGNEACGGFITVLFGVGGDLDNSKLEAYSNEIIMKLPRPKNPVYLILPNEIPCIKIDSEALMTAIGLDLQDPQMKAIVESMFMPDQELGTVYSYAFLSSILLTSVKKIIYDMSLEKQVQAISQNAQYLDVVFSRTELFTKL